MDRDPRDGVASRRFVVPALAGLEGDVEIIHRVRRRNFAGRVAVTTQNHPRRAMGFKLIGSQILAFGWTALEFRRKRDPELKGLDEVRSEHASGVPDPAA